MWRSIWIGHWDRVSFRPPKKRGIGLWRPAGEGPFSRAVWQDMMSWFTGWRPGPGLEQWHYWCHAAWAEDPVGVDGPQSLVTDELGLLRGLHRTVVHGESWHGWGGHSHPCEPHCCWKESRCDTWLSTEGPDVPPWSPLGLKGFSLSFWSAACHELSADTSPHPNEWTNEWKKYILQGHFPRILDCRILLWSLTYKKQSPGINKSEPKWVSQTYKPFFILSTLHCCVF